MGGVGKFFDRYNFELPQAGSKIVWNENRFSVDTKCILFLNIYFILFLENTYIHSYYYKS